MLPVNLDSFKNIFERELEKILTYWMTFAIDEENGGFYGAVDPDNQPVPAAEKSAILNARILWTFAAAARQFNHPGYGRIATRAYQVLIHNFQDHQLGGTFSTISAKGAPKNRDKHAYYHAFVLYAFCQYQRCHPDPGVMERIQDLFKLFEHKMKDPIFPGYLESFNQSWQLSAMNHIAPRNEAKTMNTHLHILEAFAALYQVWPAPIVQRRLSELLRLFLTQIIRPSGHLGSYFGRNFQESKHSAAICTFGHDIEASWLLPEVAQILGDQFLLEQAREISLRLLQAVTTSGIAADSGIILESTHNGRKQDPIKHWWPQAEALVGFINGYQLTGDPVYWQHLQNCWQFIDQYFIDHEKGEWFARVGREGRPLANEFPTDYKVNPWKSPYHNGRACMELIRRLGKIERLNKAI